MRRKTDPRDDWAIAYITSEGEQWLQTEMSKNAAEIVCDKANEHEQEWYRTRKFFVTEIKQQRT